MITLTCTTPSGIIRRTYFQSEVVLGSNSRFREGIDVALPLDPETRLIIREEGDHFTIYNPTGDPSILLDGKSFRQAPLDDQSTLSVGWTTVAFECLPEGASVTLPDHELDALLGDVQPVPDDAVDELLENFSVDILSPQARGVVAPLIKRAAVVGFVAFSLLTLTLWLLQERTPSQPARTIQALAPTALVRQELETLLSRRRAVLAPLAERMAQLYIFDACRPDNGFYERIEQVESAYEEARHSLSLELASEVNRLAQRFRGSSERQILQRALTVYGLDAFVQEESPPTDLVPAHVGAFQQIDLPPLESLDHQLTCLENELAQYISTGQMIRQVAADSKLRNRISLHQAVQRHRLDAMQRNLEEIRMLLPFGADDDAIVAKRLYSCLSKLCSRLEKTLVKESHALPLPSAERLDAVIDLRDEVSDARDRLGAL